MCSLLQVLRDGKTIQVPAITVLSDRDLQQCVELHFS
jgi:hypothetical protein